MKMTFNSMTKRDKEIYLLALRTCKGTVEILDDKKLILQNFNRIIKQLENNMIISEQLSEEK